MNQQTQITQNIPEPQVVRERLASIARERALLRSLLRVAEQNQKRRELDRQFKTGDDRAKHQ